MKDFHCRKHVIKNGFKLAYFLRSSQELKLEELQMVRGIDVQIVNDLISLTPFAIETR